MEGAAAARGGVHPAKRARSDNLGPDNGRARLLQNLRVSIYPDSSLIHIVAGLGFGIF
jgi:hypothetical protein